MSSSTRNRNNHDKDFDTYRQIAPASLTDQSLRNLMKEHGYKTAEINKAIESLWDDDAPSRQIEENWVTASKKKPQEPISSKPASGRGNSSGGRGRSRAPQGGRGGGRGEERRKSNTDAPSSSSRNTSVERSEKIAEMSSMKPVTSSTCAWGTAPVSKPQPPDQNLEPTNQLPPASAATPIEAASASSSSNVQTQKSVWGGASLAEKLKKAEAERLNPKVEPLETETPAIIAQAPDAEATGTSKTKRQRPKTGSGRGKQSKTEASSAAVDSVIVEQIEHLEISNGTDSVAVEVEVTTAVPLSEPVSDFMSESSAPAAVEAAVPDPVAKDSAAVTVEAPKGLKMGKWGAPIEQASDMVDSFQFGSFGNIGGEPTVEKPVPAANGATTNSWSSVAGKEENLGGVFDSNPSVWQGAATAVSSSVDAPTSSALFSQSKPIQSMSPLDSSVGSVGLGTQPTNNSANRAPPGLEPATGKQASAGRTSAVQPGMRAAGHGQSNVDSQPNLASGASVQQLPNSMLYQQPYTQSLPPGIAATSGAATGLNPSRNNVPAVPYQQYSTSFDLQGQSQFVPGYPGASSTVAPTSAASTGGIQSVAVSTQSPANSSTAGNTANPGVVNQQQQQQQQYPSAPFPFYGNPYYANQAFFYGQQPVPNFYGQDRGQYQQRPPYNNAPYGGPGGIYPTDVYQNGQFGEPGTGYGGMGLHPSMGSHSGSGPAGGANAQNKPAKNNANQGSQQQSLGNQDHGNAQHPYGFVPPYLQQPRVPMDAQQQALWQFQQQSPANGWGGPMMGFPNNNGAGGNVNVPGQQFSQHLGVGIPHNQNQPNQQQSGQLSRDGQRPAGGPSYNPGSTFSGGNRGGPGGNNVQMPGASQGGNW